MIVQLHDAFIGLRLLKVDCIWHSANVKPMDVLEVFVHPHTDFGAVWNEHHLFLLCTGLSSLVSGMVGETRVFCFPYYMTSV